MIRRSSRRKSVFPRAPITRARNASSSSNASSPMADGFLCARVELPSQTVAPCHGRRIIDQMDGAFEDGRQLRQCRCRGGWLGLGRAHTARAGRSARLEYSRCAHCTELHRCAGSRKFQSPLCSAQLCDRCAHGLRLSHHFCTSRLGGLGRCQQRIGPRCTAGRKELDALCGRQPLFHRVGGHRLGLGLSRRKNSLPGPCPPHETVGPGALRHCSGVGGAGRRSGFERVRGARRGREPPWCSVRRLVCDVRGSRRTAGRSVRPGHAMHMGPGAFRLLRPLRNRGRLQRP